MVLGMSFAFSVPQRSAKDLRLPVKMPFFFGVSFKRYFAMVSFRVAPGIWPRFRTSTAKGFSSRRSFQTYGLFLVRGCGVCDASRPLNRCCGMKARGMQSRRNAKNLRSWAKYMRVCVCACASGRVALLGPSPRRHLASEERATRAILDCLVPSQNLIIAKYLFFQPVLHVRGHSQCDTLGPQLPCLKVSKLLCIQPK